MTEENLPPGARVTILPEAPDGWSPPPPEVIKALEQHFEGLPFVVAWQVSEAGGTKLLSYVTNQADFIELLNLVNHTFLAIKGCMEKCLAEAAEAARH
jgi:hypothetical protein